MNMNTTVVRTLKAEQSTVSRNEAAAARGEEKQVRSRHRSPLHERSASTAKLTQPRQLLLPPSLAVAQAGTQPRHEAASVEWFAEL